MRFRDWFLVIFILIILLTSMAIQLVKITAWWRMASGHFH